MPASRTWVAGDGDDANPGSRLAPCKTFAGAISKTATGGEISVLNPGGFGSVTITKGLTINGDATLGSLLTAGAIPAIIVNAPASDTVILRHLSITGAGGGGAGIRYLGGGALHIENCTIANITGHGIDVNLTAAGHLFVEDTTIRSCTVNGVNIIAAGGTATASFDNVHIKQCVIGLHAGSGSRATIRNSILGSHSSTGIMAEQTAADSPKVMIERCRLSDNLSYGIRSIGVVEVRVSNCVITGNGNGWLSGGGALTLVSFGNNVVSGNGADGAPTSTLMPS
jgi:hypothetical protein